MSGFAMSGYKFLLRFTVFFKEAQKNSGKVRVEHRSLGELSALPVELAQLPMNSQGDWCKSWLFLTGVSSHVSKAQR